MKNVSVWSRSRLLWPGAGAGPIWSGLELALGPRTYRAGATQKSGGSATLVGALSFLARAELKIELEPELNILGRLRLFFLQDC